ncbi:RDD family protein [Segetibacter sp. 3557_3]|uniref:RDD family protein n=1 Tax=Segetibacter sp. 3557_3 TaxID=2547429 RepID=UPI001058B96A|nr:RDD family protein [Segetibacter sp. 3557_3]TDH18408.1 RDD family protein [Segetibacter sp. 3557_3]
MSTILAEVEVAELKSMTPAYELVQASSWKRFANYVVDLVFLYMIMFFWGVIIALASPEVLESIDESENVFGSFADRIIGLLVYGLVMSLIEAIFQGKSIGKFITGTKAVNANGSTISFGKAFARGFSRAVPFNAFSALGNPCYPWHDKWTDTYVIDEKATRRHNEMLRSN